MLRFQGRLTDIVVSEMDKNDLYQTTTNITKRKQTYVYVHMYIWREREWDLIHWSRDKAPMR